MTDSTTHQGVRNLLVHCGKARPGQRLLLACETEALGYYDREVSDMVAKGAVALGLNVSRIEVGFDAENPLMPSHLLQRIKAADIVVFLARLGDQLRFSQMPDDTILINSYTLNAHLLNSTFASAHYDGFVALKRAVDRRIAGAKQITITCPAGTLVHGCPDLHNKPAPDTALRRFPMSVFSPVPAQGFSGRVALGGFLTGTGSRYYGGYSVEFDGQVFAILNGGRLAGFDGSTGDVLTANAHYDRVAGLFGIDRDFVHSWHAGIHPGCGFPWDIRKNYARWSGAAFGNPRVVHFHTCGAYAPGEISWNAFDPTIEIDGQVIWEHGVFHAGRLSEGPEILDRYPCAAAVFARPDRDIGLRDVPLS